MTRKIKIDFYKKTFTQNYLRKIKITNLPLNGIYEDKNGDIHYYAKGILHNENGPAFIGIDGYKEYLVNGKWHRIDGPAIVYSSTKKYEWWINGYRIDNEEMNTWLIKNNIPLDWNAWSDSDKNLFSNKFKNYSITEQKRWIFPR